DWTALQIRNRPPRGEIRPATIQFRAEARGTNDSDQNNRPPLRSGPMSLQLPPVARSFFATELAVRTRAARHCELLRSGVRTGRRASPSFRRRKRSLIRQIAQVGERHHEYRLKPKSGNKRRVERG